MRVYSSPLAGEQETVLERHEEDDPMDYDCGYWSGFLPGQPIDYLKEKTILGFGLWTITSLSLAAELCLQRR